MKISTHCTYFMTSLPIVNHIGIVNVEPMWDIDISDTPKRFVHSSRTQIFEFPVNRSDFRHHAMRDTWRLNYNHRERHRMGKRMCKCNPIFISHCNPVQGQYRARTGISLWSFPTEGKTFFYYREPLFSLQGFPCEKNFTGKTLFSLQGRVCSE